MFNKKQEVKEEVNQVKCEECKHYVDREDAQEVIDLTWIRYYCPMHRKPYDKCSVYFNGKRSYYKKWVEVTREGKVITPKGK